MSINKKLLPAKAHYFIKNAASASIIPFLPLVAKNLRFPSSALGTILTAVPLLSLVTKPLAGIIADKFGAHKPLYLFFLVVTVGCTLFINHLPPLPADQTVTMRCSEVTDIIVSTNRGEEDCYMKRLRTLMDNLPLPCQMFCNDTQDLVNVLNDHQRDWDILNSADGFTVGISFPLAKEPGKIHLKLDYINTSQQSWLEPSCETPGEWDCQLSCKNQMVHDLVTKPRKTDEPITEYSQFWVIAATMVMLKLSVRNLATIGDTICFKLLGNKPNNVGYQMMWGGASWGLVAVGTTFMVDILSEGEPVKDFTYAIYTSAGFFVLNLIVGMSFDLKGEKNAGSFRKMKYYTCLSPSTSIFIAWVIACGMFSAVTWNYLLRLIIEVAREDGCSDATWVKTLNFFALGVQCFLGEVPFFYFSGWMLSNLGQATCMSIVLLGFSLRFTLYYFLTSAWWILPIEILNGLTHATFQATMLTYANGLALEGTSATVQGIVSAVFEGIGVTIGSVIGGQLMDRWGVRQLFLFTGLLSAAFAISHIALILKKTLGNSASRSTYDRKLPSEQFEVSDYDDESR